MNFNLQDKLALVSGSTKGIGFAIVQGLAREGARVILTDVDEAGGARVAAEIGPSAEFIR